MTNSFEISIQNDLLFLSSRTSPLAIIHDWGLLHELFLPIPYDASSLVAKLLIESHFTAKWDGRRIADDCGRESLLSHPRSPLMRILMQPVLVYYIRRSAELLT